MEGFLIILVGVIGVVIGTQFSIIVQLFILVPMWMWLVKQHELGGIVIQFIGMIFTAGIAVGNLSFYLQTHELSFKEINVLSVKKEEKNKKIESDLKTLKMKKEILELQKEILKLQKEKEKKNEK